MQGMFYHLYHKNRKARNKVFHWVADLTPDHQECIKSVLLPRVCYLK